jgi:hypothetical protein
VVSQAATAFSSIRSFDHFSIQSLLIPNMDRKQVSIELTNKLSTLLDAARNEELTSELRLPPDPCEALSRVLSSSVTSTASSSVLLNTAQQGSSVGFRTIGFSQCRIVFERPGRAYAVKIARPSFENALWAVFLVVFLYTVACSHMAKLGYNVNKVRCECDRQMRPSR